VRDFLVSRGVSSSRITTVSYGKERPIDPGTSEDAYQRNRNAHTAITSGAR
jgi:peptidoglycan-associated lipoprotein